MKREDSDKVIDTMMKDIVRNKYVDFERTRLKCLKLIELSKKQKYNYGIAFGEYYLCELCMYNDDLDGMIDGVIDLIPYITDNRFEDLLMRAYNILGIAFFMKGNLITAMDYYLKAVDCKECEDYDAILALVYGNASCVYGSIGAYEDQLRCCKVTYELYKKQKERPDLVVPKLMSLINIAEVYLKLNDKKKAGKYIEMIENYRGKDKLKPLAGFDYEVLCFKYEFLSENYEKAYSHLDAISKVEADIFDKMVRFEGYLDVCQMLIEKGEYARITNMIEYLKKKSKSSSVTYLKLALAELEIKYYKAIKDQDNLVKAYEMFYQCEQESKQRKKEEYVDSIKARVALKEAIDDKFKVMQNNSELKNLAEIDELTKLPNRRKYEMVINEMYKEAKGNNLNLGVILVDVDCFKQYNDTYGHVKGDSCLKKIGTQLKKEMQEDVLCARYGGDEFCIILLNKTSDFVQNCAERIEKNVLKLGLKHETSLRHNKVSITTGIFNGVPDELSTIEGFINKADENLYNVKHEWKKGKTKHQNKSLAIY